MKRTIIMIALCAVCCCKNENQSRNEPDPQPIQTEFLKGGDKIKVSVRFRKRAIAHPQLGEELLDKFKEACAEVGTVEKPAKMEGRALVMFVSPKASK